MYHPECICTKHKKYPLGWMPRQDCPACRPDPRFCFDCYHSHNSGECKSTTYGGGGIGGVLGETCGCCADPSKT